jgi:predicted aspartyl protease
MKVGNPAKLELTKEVEFLVDSGAIFAVVPARILKKLGIKPYKTEEFRLENGLTIKRKIGMAMYRYKDRVGGADVIFVEPKDSTLFGALAMEALGFWLDPLKRELKPLPMILA